MDVIDLRWGVNTSELESDEGGKKVLKICLNEIEKCRPYIIVLLGERYGWVPNNDIMESTIEKEVQEKEKEGKDYRDLLKNINKSVTELEIEYGALLNKENIEHCFFYFRNPLPKRKMSEEKREVYLEKNHSDKLRLKKLKTKINKKFGNRVRYYDVVWDDDNQEITDVSSFEDMVTNDIIGLIKKELGEIKTFDWHEKEEIGFRNIINEKSTYFVGQEQLLQSLDEFIYNNDYSIYFLKGEAGSGKSSVLCKYVKKLEQDEDVEVFPYLCANSSKTSYGENVIVYYIKLLEKLINVDEVESKNDDLLLEENEDFSMEFYQINEAREHLSQLIEKWIDINGKTMVLAVDAIDQLHKTQVSERFLWLPKRYFSRLKIIITCAQEDITIINPEYSKRIQSEYMKPLHKKDRIDVINYTLKKNHKESLPNEVVEVIVNRWNSKNHLYLSLIIKRLLILDKEDFDRIEADRIKRSKEGVVEDGQLAITRYMVNLVNSLSEDMEQLCAQVIYNASKKIKTNEELSQTIIFLLAVSRTGLRKTDLVSICEYLDVSRSEIDFVDLKRYLGHFLITRGDGEVDFSHKSIRIGLLKCMTPRHIEILRESIYTHLEELDFSDPIRLKEIIYYLYSLDKGEDLMKYINLYTSLASYEEIKIKKHVAKDFVSLILVGGLDWFNKLIKNWIQNGKHRHGIISTIDFLCEDCKEAFFDPGSTQQLTAFCSILNNICLYFREFIEKTNNDYSQFEANDDTDFWIEDELDDEIKNNIDEYAWRAIGDAYLLMSQVYFNLSNKKMVFINAKNAVEVYEFIEENMKGWLDKDCFLKSYMQMARGSEDFLNRQLYYNKALEIYNLMEKNDKNMKERDITKQKHDILARLAFNYLDENKIEESKEILELLKKGSENESDIYSLTCALLEKEGKYEEAIEHIKKTIEIYRERTMTFQSLSSYIGMSIYYGRLSNSYLKLGKTD